ncbi:MAG: cell division protein FtsQ/DivIB [Gemmatimonadales bacterium]
MAGRRLTRRWVALFALGGVLLAMLVGPRVLQELSFFRVRRVEIAGLQYLAPAKIMSALKLSTDASVFDDPAPLVRRALSVPGIKSVTVQRRMPGTLEIAVEEAVPVAIAPGKGGLSLLDAAGKVLPFDPVTSAPDLPLAVNGDGVVAAVLARVRDFAPDLFARVSEGWRVGPDVVLEVEGRRLWFGAQVSSEDIRAVMAVEQTLARQGRQFQELDGRYAGQVIVRGWRG